MGWSTSFFAAAKKVNEFSLYLLSCLESFWEVLTQEDTRVV